MQRLHSQHLLVEDNEISSRNWTKRNVSIFRLRRTNLAFRRLAPCLSRRPCKQRFCCFQVFICLLNLQRIADVRKPRQLSRYTDSLWDGRYGDRIRAGARFSAPIRTCPGPTELPTQWVSEESDRGVALNHPNPSSAEVKERVELYLYSPYGYLWPAPGWTLSFSFFF
jgi:hypothetical protein